jgi:WD40 repeat protein
VRVSSGAQVVTVWQYWARRRRLAVKVCLYGHEEAVTCLAASPAYNLVVSGSRDGHAIVWDVERGAIVRQLPAARAPAPAAPVCALAVDDLTVSSHLKFHFKYLQSIYSLDFAPLFFFFRALPQIDDRCACFAWGS